MDTKRLEAQALLLADRTRYYRDDYPDVADRVMMLTRERPLKSCYVEAADRLDLAMALKQGEDR